MTNTTPKAQGEVEEKNKQNDMKKEIIALIYKYEAYKMSMSDLIIKIDLLYRKEMEEVQEDKKTDIKQTNIKQNAFKLVICRECGTPRNILLRYLNRARCFCGGKLKLK